MSTFAEFEKEKMQIDEVMAQGYMVLAIRETLDGAMILFARNGNSKESTQLQLLTADARKYVTSLLFGKKDQAQSG
ncbi:hypothetical protein ACE3MZ_02945 [Paenibacillus sp. WLX1005]|uniref:hypothetical protein n=1 Tax=Paenibacillus sp. WLX1005 TaxID=3243766 RepID=UPI003983E033